jgi:phospholipase D1/2
MSDRKSTWIRVLGVLLFFALLAAAWQWTPLKGLLDLQRVADWVEPHRTAWYAPPVVVAAFVVLGILMVPVLLLITATGIAFGPWLGSIYALAGALTSASVGFAFGRLAGQHRIERVGGRKIGDISRKIERNGTLAVYVIRKIPMPFLFSNLVIGASRVRFRDFLLGSILGLGPIVIALAGFGYHLTRSLDEPTPAKIAVAVGFLAVPLTIAWILNRVLRRSRRAS